MPSTLPATGDVKKESGEYSVSLYVRGKMSPQAAIDAMKTLCGCFPQTDPVVFDSFFAL